VPTAGGGGEGGRAQGARTRAPRLPPPSPRTGRPAALGRPPARDFTILSPCPPMGGARRPCDWDGLHMQCSAISGAVRRMASRPLLNVLGVSIVQGDARGYKPIEGATQPERAGDLQLPDDATTASTCWSDAGSFARWRMAAPRPTDRSAVSIVVHDGDIYITREYINEDGDAYAATSRGITTCRRHRHHASHDVKVIKSSRNTTTGWLLVRVRVPHCSLHCNVRHEDFQPPTLCFGRMTRSPRARYR
jgi:hypothetical protein